MRLRPVTGHCDTISRNLARGGRTFTDPDDLSLHRVIRAGVSAERETGLTLTLLCRLGTFVCV